MWTSKWGQNIFEKQNKGWGESLKIVDGWTLQDDLAECGKQYDGKKKYGRLKGAQMKCWGGQDDCECRK